MTQKKFEMDPSVFPLRVAEEDESKEPEYRTMNENTYRQARVLILDDNAFARDVGRRILKAAGLNAIEDASSGQEALDLLRKADRSIDIIFCDLMMPDMDGVEFVRHVSTLPALPAFVFVSGADAALLSAVENTAKARNLRILGTIKKPLTLATARQVLELFDNAAPAAGGDTGAAVSITPEELEAALANDQFVLHYQPKISLSKGALDGFESLVRWQHPEHGIIPPGAFVAAAEKNGLIGAMTDRTMTLALRQRAAWAAAGLHVKVSVNLSAYMLVDVDLPDRLAREAAQFGVDPQQVILEVTETGLFQDVANSLEILARLHMKGFSLSIDDFGTGYSSMEQLSRIPFAEMKIDRAFIHRAAENPTAKAILESSVDLGRKMELTIVAEGAETSEDCDLLRKVGVDIVQGYFIAKPMASEEVQAWSAAWNPASRGLGI
jgi:EAL domain-containing protein (putative c-di-GMP-specific phosphodiesterase class I)